MRSSGHPQQPIGIFDSGIGGLTVANAIHSLLPQEQLIYFGDTAHLPYGDKSADAIRFYCLKIAKFLLEQDCKLIVVACNSASSAGYKVLLEFFRGQTLFANVVDPLVEEVLRRDYRKVGIIGTKATIHSGIYQEQLHRQRPGLEVSALATPLLAPMIEEGYLHHEISQVVLSTYLRDPGLRNIDALLLACTHYPLIQEDIREYFNRNVDVFDSAGLVACHVREILQQHNLLSPERREAHRFLVSDYTPSFEAITRLFYPKDISLEFCPLW